MQNSTYISKVLKKSLETYGVFANILKMINNEQMIITQIIT